MYYRHGGSHSARIGEGLGLMYRHPWGSDTPTVGRY